MKTLTAAVNSAEDHGYILDLGIPKVSGFLPLKDAENGPFDPKGKLHVGQLLNVSVVAPSSNGRTCTVTVDEDTFTSSSVSPPTQLYKLMITCSFSSLKSQTCLLSPPAHSFSPW